MSDKNKQINLLGQLIKFRSNDLLMDIQDNRVTEEAEHHITELIMEITRYIHGIRYCSNPDCLCSPESGIKHHYEHAKDYLQGTKYALNPIPWWVIENILEKETNQ